MKKELVNEIKKMDGTFLGIGLDEKLINIINDMPFSKITFLESKDEGKKLKRKSEKQNYFKSFFTFDKQETVNLKKMKKSFKKKSIDNILCNYKYVKKYLKNFVPDSVSLTSKKILIYGDGNIDDILYRFKRLTKNVKVIEKNKQFLIVVDTKDIKNNKLRDLYYYILDSVSSILNFVADILID